MYVRSTVLEPAGLDLISSVMGYVLLSGFRCQTQAGSPAAAPREQHVRATDLQYHSPCACVV
jgi:hypothetical protein